MIKEELELNPEKLEKLIEEKIDNKNLQKILLSILELIDEEEESDIPVVSTGIKFIPASMKDK